MSHADQPSLNAVVKTVSLCKFQTQRCWPGKATVPGCRCACTPCRALSPRAPRGLSHTPAFPLQGMQPSGHLRPFHYHCHFLIPLHISLCTWSAANAVFWGIRQNRSQTRWCGLCPQSEHQKHHGWSADTPDWLKDRMLCLPSQRTYDQPYLGAQRPTEPTPLHQGPLWLHQDPIHWKEPYLPFQRRWWAGCGFFRLETARVSRRVRGRAKDRLTYPRDMAFLGGGRGVQDSSRRKHEGKG